MWTAYPHGEDLDKIIAFQEVVTRDFDEYESTLHTWFGIQMDVRTRVDPNNILPVTTAGWDNMISIFSPRNTSGLDPNYAPYFVKYLMGNSFVVPAGTGTSIVPLDVDANGSYIKAPVVFIASMGPNGRWDVPTAQNGAGLNVPSTISIMDIVAGTMTNTGDDQFRIINFKPQLDQAIEETKTSIRSIATGLSIYFNILSVTEQGYYPASLAALVLWLNVKDTAATLASQSASTVDGFGYPLKYTPLLGLGGDLTKPLQVELTAAWLKSYNL